MQIVEKIGVNNKIIPTVKTAKHEKKSYKKYVINKTISLLKGMVNRRSKYRFI